VRWFIGCLWFALALALTAPSAFAQAGPSFWSYTMDNQPKPGKPASLTLTPRGEVRAAHLTLRSSTGKTQAFKLGTMQAGKGKTIRFEVPEGRSEWSADLLGSVGGSTTNMSMTLTVISSAPLDVKVPKEHVDVSQGRLLLRSNNPLDRVEVQAYTVTGEKVVDTTVDLGGRAGEVPVEFIVPSDEPIRRLELKVHDRIGYWNAVRLVDFYVEVPHETVQFETAKFDVPSSEAGKLDLVVLTVQDEINRFRDELGDRRARVDVALYVAGFTDTVGSKADNEVLSRKRAQTIGRYFWANGIGVPIYYAGFGEDALAVPTADEVDKAENRRTMYILTNTRPRMDMRGRSWKKLR